MQLSVKTDARSEFLRAPPVTLLPLFRKTHGHGAWPRAAQDFKILEPFFFPSDSFNGWICVGRGSAALPPPCVLPKKVWGTAALLVTPAFLRRAVPPVSCRRSVLPASWALSPRGLFLPGSAAFFPPRFRLVAPATSTGGAWWASGHCKSWRRKKKLES